MLGTNNKLLFGDHSGGFLQGANVPHSGTIPQGTIPEFENLALREIPCLQRKWSALWAQWHKTPGLKNTHQRPL